MINDFQIEGMSIGENLIKHAETIGVSVNEIKSYNLFYPKSKKYAGISLKTKVILKHLMQFSFL